MTSLFMYYQINFLKHAYVATAFNKLVNIEQT